MRRTLFRPTLVSDHAEPPAPNSATDNVSALIERLHETEQRLEELTDGEVDAVLDSHGNPFLLRRAHDQLRSAQAVKQAASEEDLRRLAAIVENSADAIISVNIEGVITSWNPAAARMFGHTAPDIIGRPSACLVPPEGAAEHLETRTGIVRGERALQAETVWVRKGGERVDVSVTASPIQNSLGHIVGVSKIVRDIGERKRSELALRDSQEQIRFLNDLGETTRQLSDPARIVSVVSWMLGEHMRASRCGYATVDEDGLHFTIVHDYTDGCASSMGRYDLSALGGRLLAKLQSGETVVIRDAQAELPPEEGARGFYAAQVLAIICCPLVKQGTLRAMMAVHQSAPRDWKPGEVAVVQEVAARCWATIEHRTAEQALRHSEALLRIAGQTARLGGWAVELPDVRILWSDEMCAIHEVPPGTVPGLKQAFSFYAPQSRAAATKAFVACARAGTPFDLELELTTAGGRSIWARSIGDAQRNAAGTITRVQGAFQDITERKRAEIRIAFLNRVYAMLSGINALIARGRDRDELFRNTCRIAVTEGGFAMAWIAVVDAPAMKLVPVAYAGGNAALIAATDDRLASDAGGIGGNGLLAQAFRQKKPVVHNDIANDPSIGIGRTYSQFGIRSIAALPLIVGGEVVGMLALQASETEFFHSEEINLLAELAVDIAFAIDHIDIERRIARLSRIEALVSGINSVIVRAADRQELLSEVCRIAVALGGFAAARIGSSVPDDIENNDDILRALAEKRTVINNDLAAASAPPRSDHLSSIALPLVVDGTAVEALALFARERAFFNVDELKMLNELAANVAYALESIARREQVYRLAYFDPVTGLANRALFHQRLDQRIAAAALQGRSFALVLVDIERFKAVNDALGRPAGDELLKAFAGRLSRQSADADRVARHGADHFSLTVPDIETRDELPALIAELAGGVCGPFFRSGDSHLTVGAKFGIAMFPGDGADADTLFKNADAALSDAKRRGERYSVYSPAMNARAVEKLSLETRLRQAIEREEFVLYYQPKLHLASGRLMGAEALIRWNDPLTGLVPPLQFIPILEATGLISEVGRWALGRAIADCLRWRSAGFSAGRVAVNVSPLQLRNPHFITDVRQAIGSSPEAAAGLELEITESVIMEDVKRNIATLQAIRDMHVTIAVDDFGTGFSSLSYLAKLPLDTLKIDRSFVTDLTAGAKGLALVSTVIKLAHALDLKVVAEGVETEAQARLLRLLNCDEVQGFLFARPLPGDQFEANYLAAGATHKKTPTF